MRIETGRPIEASLFGFPAEAGFPPVVAIATHSAQIRPGDLFVALKGEKTDGAAFVGEAISRGASLALSSREENDPRVLAVPDPLAALTEAARVYAWSIPHKTAAITGSYGKTTLRTALTSILSPAIPLARTEGNGNTDLAIALTLLSMKPDVSLLLCELGMRGRGEIARLSRLVLPDLAVITAVGSAHVGRLGSLDAIREAKCEIALGMTPNGTLLYPAADKELEKRIRRLNVRGESVSTDPAFPGDYTLKRIGECDGRALVSLSSPFGKRFCVLLPDASNATVTTAAFAFAVCEKLGIDRALTRKGLSSFQPPPLRREVRVIRGVRVVLDCYNASPEPTLAALDDLEKIGKTTRVFLVLGEMLELGDASPSLHRAVGRRAAKIPPARLYTVGELAKEYAVGAVDAGLPSSLIRSFGTDELTDLAAVLKSETKPNDVVFVKGSRALSLERLIPLLTEGDRDK